MLRRNAWALYDEAQSRKAMDFCDEYKSFLNAAKTEREAVETIVNEAEDAGYKELSELIRQGEKLQPGDKAYSVCMDKSVVLFKVGKRPLTEGMNILGAHIDSPRIDVKQNPLYESDGIAYLDTHYYGGIKKYQYVAMPLALHGTVVKKDGSSIVLSIGEDEDEPVFFISDILIHLAADQMAKPAAKAVEGEALDLILGSRPFVLAGSDEDKKPEGYDLMTEGQKAAVDAELAEKRESGRLSGAVRRMMLAVLKDEYGIDEEDFISAELEIVPAGKARDAGIDRSMILGYGHDDRVCAFPSYRAMFAIEVPERTACCILVDKEEIGSVGATGMQSHFFENAVAELLALTGDDSHLALRRCLASSFMLSSDVSAAYDPLYAAQFEKKNAALLGGGLVFNKFTGSRGKSGSNDANAEYLAEVRRVMDEGGVCFQTAELGGVDVGGGGTIAYILALYGMNVVDSGVPVLSMHAPWEAVSKADVYEAYKGYIAFLNGCGVQ